MKFFKMFVLLSLALFLIVEHPHLSAASSKDHSSSSTLKVRFYSEALQKDMSLNIYLPPNYDAQDKYPVLYVLHSYKLNEDHWFEPLKVTKQADALIANGTIEPMIIVAPRIDNSFGVNSSDPAGFITGSGKPGDAGVLYTGMYEDYITKDVISYVDQHFKTIKSPLSRYIGGTSMGGFAALHIGLRHPQLYSKVGGHAPALFLGSMWAPLEKLVFPTEEARNAHDPLALATSQKLNKLSIYLDCGDQDDFLNITKKLNETLSAQTTKSYEFHLTEGGHHDDAYWSSQMDNYLKFYGGMDKN